MEDRELTEEIKEAICEGVIADLHPSHRNNKNLIAKMCKMREEGYIKNDYEVDNNG